MVTKKKHESSHLSILEAVEALESIADLEFEREIDLATDEEINEQNHQVMMRAVKWLGREDPDGTVKLIKETFHVVLNYLRDFYQHDYRHITDPKIIEGVKTIMVLVGDAAQKLDRYTTLFKETKFHNVKEIDEYKQLQEFYLTRIARKIDEGVLGKWILELTKGSIAKKAKETKTPPKKPISAKYIFIDLESVKKDTEYELFFLRKEDGSRFFNPRLIRNIKLVCDFGETIKRDQGDDPLEDIKVWQDYTRHIASREMILSMGGLIDRYFKETNESGKWEVVAELNKAFFALMMCSNPKNLLKSIPVKSCSEYFLDFHYFLRRALNSREYQRFIVYPPKKTARFANCILETVHALCGALFSSVHGYHELIPVFEKLFQESRKKMSYESLKAARESKMLWSYLASDHVAMKKLMKKHPNGPLEKVLEILDVGTYHVFDPIGQSNIPNHLYSLYTDGHKITNIRIPSPTFQEFIHMAHLVEEFKGFLRFYSKGQLKRKHLMINLQDRTSWKEHIRCLELEEAQNINRFGSSLEVVTLPTDTEFYHQSAPYHQDNHAKVFIAHFKDQLNDENCGFYFPDSLKKKLFPKFINGLITTVHEVFFGGMNVLTVNNRRDFIEIFYFFLQLKILELTNPDSFSFTCKDGIDADCSASAQLYALIKILSPKGYKESDIDKINLILYMAPLLLRERVILPEKFERMMRTIKRVEGIKSEMGEKEFLKTIRDQFGKFYVIPIFDQLTM